MTCERKTDMTVEGTKSFQNAIFMFWKLNIYHPQPINLLPHPKHHRQKYSNTKVIAIMMLMIIE